MGRGKSAIKSLEELLSESPGIELHGKNLRLCFRYRRILCRETLGIPLTRENLQYAKRRREAILYEIQRNTFDYAKEFPDSVKLRQFGIASRRKATMAELVAKAKKFKAAEIAATTARNQAYSFNRIIDYFGSDTDVRSIMPEDVEFYRATLIENYAANTVNNYMSRLRDIFSIAQRNHYTDHDLVSCCCMFSVDREDPDPLSKEEYQRILSVAPLLFRHLITFAVYTGMRIGEICALAWEDVDFISGTVTVQRNKTALGYKLPKSGKSRQIQLFPPALESLRAMKQMTFMYPEEKISVSLKQKKVIQRVRFVFNKNCYYKHETGSLSPHKVLARWRTLLKRAGVRYRRLHQTRHTFACWTLTATGNISFIADQLGHVDFTMLQKVYGKWIPSQSRNESSRVWGEMCRIFGDENNRDSNEGCL
ncbi:site-specific integrase [Kistimonas scapharcae]|uniref:Site-specific integrase n=1 Tax=Kistimonas scapharcae TaxID=1036133 RepID=A0ABP8UXQ7_9GAMM